MASFILVTLSVLLVLPFSTQQEALVPYWLSSTLHPPSTFDQLDPHVPYICPAIQDYFSCPLCKQFVKNHQKGHETDVKVFDMCGSCDFKFEQARKCMSTFEGEVIPWIDTLTSKYSPRQLCYMLNMCEQKTDIVTVTPEEPIPVFPRKPIQARSTQGILNRLQT